MIRSNKIFKTKGSLRRKNKEGSNYCCLERNQTEESDFNDFEVQHYIGKNKFVYLAKNENLTEYSISFWKKGYNTSKTEQNKKSSNNKRQTRIDVHKKKKTNKNNNAEDLQISNSKCIISLKKEIFSKDFRKSNHNNYLTSSTSEIHTKKNSYSPTAPSKIKKVPNGFQSSSNNSKFTTLSTRQELPRDSQSSSNNIKDATSSIWKEHSKYFQRKSRKYTTLLIKKKHPKTFQYSLYKSKGTTSSTKEVLPEGFQRSSKRKKPRKVKRRRQINKVLVRQEINTKRIYQKKQNIHFSLPLTILELKASRARQRYKSKKKDNRKRNIVESLRYQRKPVTNVRRNERLNLIGRVLTDDTKPGSLWFSKGVNNRLKITTLKSTDHVLHDNRLDIKKYLKINTVKEKPFIENHRKQVAYTLSVNNDRSMIITRLSKRQIVGETVYLPTRQRLQELKSEEKLKRKLRKKKKSVLEDERYVTPIFDNTLKQILAGHMQSRNQSKKKQKTRQNNKKCTEMNNNSNNMATSSTINISYQQKDNANSKAAPTTPASSKNKYKKSKKKMKN